ncbi:MAG: hypothetical protein KDJ38_09250 [Gammaproteobacteria bacterium]|nr:hypothetical protein [Gammaproteobacteria bacterium]
MLVILSGQAACAKDFHNHPGLENVEGTKFHPGHYVFTSVSRGYPPRERNIKRLDIIETYLDNPDIRGFMSSYEWRELETRKDKYTLDAIAAILTTLEGTDKRFIVYVRDRDFGKTCKKAPVPAYLFDKVYGRPYKHKDFVCMIEVYNPAVVDRKIALYRAIAERFDRHPNFEMIMDGESTIGGSAGYSDQAWADELKRFYTEVKKYFKHTMVLVQLNFLGDGSVLLDEIAGHIEQVGGGAIGLPDTVPCRRLDIRAKDVCDYQIPGYATLRKYAGRVAIAPSVATWDLEFDQTDEVFDMAVNYLQANHVIWSSVFTSRREKKQIDPASYMGEQIVPLLKRRGEEFNADCPASLKPCLTD